MPNQEQSSNINAANYFASGISDDIHDLFKDEKGWLAARNAVASSPLNDFNALSNEMSNFNVANAPYTIIGTIYITDGEWAVFSTDDTNCEIGVFNENTDTYERIVNSTDLNFKKSNLIKGVGRIKRYCHRTIYWDDNLNPSRYLDLDDIPWKGDYIKDGDCKHFKADKDVEYKHQDKNNRNDELKFLDTKKIYLTPFSENGLQFKLSLGDAAGEVFNGTYTVVGYYSYGGSANPLTAYYSVSNPQPVFNHNDQGGSLEVTVEQCDESFEEFTLFVNFRVKGSLILKKIGTYSTSVKKIYISQIKLEEDVDDYRKYLTDIEYPVKSAGIYRLDNYLVRIKPTNHQKFNYQNEANKIKVQWISVKYPADYYKKGGNSVGYMRDEVYSFFIRWVYNTGEKTPIFHIPGRKSNDIDNMDINDYLSGYNQNSPEYYNLKANIVLPEVDENADNRHECWRYVNTARELAVIEDKNIRTDDGGLIHSYGDMGYWESDETYNDKAPELYGELCGKHIRHHKMPNNIVSPHYGKDSSGTYIYVLGVNFSNISKPKKFNGYDSRGKATYTEIEDIIGYEILRGTREGNKSILAKGMINNMRMYETSDEEQILYQNYPYNPISNSDLFISRNKLQFHNFCSNGSIVDPRGKEMISRRRGYRYLANADTIKAESEKDLYKYENYVSHRYFTFHSPDLKINQDKQYTKRLSAKELDTYMVMLGTMDDTKFVVPKGAPKQKLMMTNSLLVSMALGVGFALFKMYGVKHNIIKAPVIDHGPAMAGYGVVEMSSGSAGVSAPNAMVQNAAALATTGLNNMLNNILNEYGNIAGSVTGTDFAKTMDQLKVFLGNAEATVGGKSPESTEDTESTPWSNIPKFLKKLAKIPMFLTFWGDGIEQVFEMMYTFAPYRDHILQQVSHGFYNDVKEVGISKRYSLDAQSYLSRNAFTQMTDGTRVNNIKRNDTVAIKTGLPLSDVELMKNGKGIEFSQVLASDVSFDKDLASFYSALKQPLPSQYGQLTSIYTVPASYKVILNDKNSNPTQENVIFGGDTYIGRYTEKNTMFFFYDWLNGQPDGEPYNYWDYPMINYPRFWMNTNKFNITNIFDSVGKLFNNKTSVDFDPFQKSSRFIDEEVVIDKLTLPNPEVVLTTINLNTGNDNNPYFYPEYVRYHEDNESVKIDYSSLYDYSNTNDDINDAIDDLFTQENKSISDEDNDLNNETEEEQAQSHLTRFNNNRRCSCDYKFLLGKINSGYHINKSNDRKEYDITLGDDGDKKYVDAYYLLNDNDTKDDDSFIYSHNNPYSLINCEFFEYKENKAKGRRDITEDDKFRYFGKEKTEKLWYDKPFRLGKKDYDKLCELKSNIKKTELTYAILQGYIHFLQQVVDIEDDGTDEEFEEDNNTEAHVQFCPSCWTRRRMSEKRRAKKNRKVHREVTDYFSDSWHDDYTLTYENGMKGVWYGYSDGIPYTRATDKINPLLAYFIQQETDIVLNYPDIEYDDQNNKYKLHIENDDYHSLLWSDSLLTGVKDDDSSYYRNDETYCYKLDSRDGYNYIVYDTTSIPLELISKINTDGEIRLVIYNAETGEYMESNSLDFSNGRTERTEETADGLSAETLEEIWSYRSDIYQSFSGYKKGVYNKINKHITSFWDSGVFKTLVSGSIFGLILNKNFKWRKGQSDDYKKDIISSKAGEFQDDEENRFPLSFLTLESGCGTSGLYKVFENFDSWKEAVGGDFTSLSSSKYADIEKEGKYIFDKSGTSINIGYTLYRAKNTAVTLDEIITCLESKDDNVEYDDIFTSSNLKDENFYLKYWTIDGVRSILSKRMKSKRRRVYEWYSIQSSTGDLKIIKGEKCDQLQKYFSDSGTLYRISKRYNRDIEKANKKYQKLVQKFNRQYVKKLAKKDHSKFFDRIKSAINSITPASYYALDYVGGGTELASMMPSKLNSAKVAGISKLSLFAHDMYMYQFVSGVRDFFVESEQNIDLRDWEDYNAGRYYDSSSYNDLREIFNTDDIDKREMFILDQNLTPGNMYHLSRNTFSKSADNMLSSTWSEAEAYECNTKYDNRIIYSNADNDSNLNDNWRVYMYLNYKDFDDEINSCLFYDNGMAIMFQNSSPITFSSEITLNTSKSSQKLRVLTGSGEILNGARHKLEDSNSFEYGSCQDSNSVINTPSGIYYVSQEQGRILTFTNASIFSSKTTIKEMSSYASGLNAWFKHYMPYMLTRDKEVFSNTEFELTDNPVAGIGFQSSYDNSNHILYISKKDYRIKPEYRDQMKYIGNGVFTNKFGTKINLGDKKYFDDASFTISYDNRIGKSGSFISWHDWHPDLVMNSKNNIYSIKNNGIWKHNYSSHKIGTFNPFCNFYGVDYPFEVEFNINSENSISTLRNISYFLECFVYDENDYDRFHKLFENFDKAMIYNTEQISGQLNLVHQEKENPDKIPEYPKIVSNSAEPHIDILWSKEEQRYRFNQFWDITRNRQSNENYTMFNTKPNGYVREINPNYVNYKKDEFERKKFRHRINKVRLTRTKSGEVNLVFSLSMNNNLTSYR